MALPKEYIPHFATQLVKRLASSGKVRFQSEAAAIERVQQVLLDDIAVEDMLNQEVRDVLEQYQERIRRDAISYQEMYKMVKREVMKKHKVTISNRPEPDSKYSRDKVIDLSHKMIQSAAGAGSPIELADERNEVRLEFLRQMQGLLKEENLMDHAVREKIRSQKREIAEGSGEWDILFRRYYSEELRKLGIQ